MTPPCWVVLVLYVLGGLLTLVGLGDASLRARRRLHALNEGLHGVEDIDRDTARRQAASGVSGEEHLRLGEEGEARKRAVFQSNTSWGTLEYGREYAERDFLQHLTQPAWLAGVGILFATAGSVLSLWL